MLPRGPLKSCAMFGEWEGPLKGGGRRSFICDHKQASTEQLQQCIAWLRARNPQPHQPEREKVVEEDEEDEEGLFAIKNAPEWRRLSPPREARMPCRKTSMNSSSSLRLLLLGRNSAVGLGYLLPKNHHLQNNSSHLRHVVLRPLPFRVHPCQRAGSGAGGAPGLGVLRLSGRPTGAQIERGLKWSPNRPERPPTPQEVGRSTQPAESQHFPEVAAGAPCARGFRPLWALVTRLRGFGVE